jgi:acyl carrier protein phosphodiesterase|tara:strand:+ start:11738 stop:12325 length:588 start_codon:yes stop_codon:yes gene_type:complete
LNYLAHLFLSGNHDLLKIGNFLGDFVRSKDLNDYPEEVQKGILLHRKIDLFTDTHPIVFESKRRLRNQFGHYAPVITDIFYDHFLALNWHQYSAISLLDFSQDFYRLTECYATLLPEKPLHVLRYMKRDNWLFEYRTLKGIEATLAGMSRRSKFDSKMEYASAELKKNSQEYQQEFHLFFPVLMEEARQFRVKNL